MASVSLNKLSIDAYFSFVFDEVIEGMTIAVVDDLVVWGRKLLEALCSDGGEVAFEISELGEDHRAASDEAVDQRLLLRHFFREP